MSAIVLDDPTGGVETPSGKGSADENFPVGSFLISRRHRPHIARFYAFARAIDDIADNPTLAPEDKIARLDGMDRALIGAEEGDPAYIKAHRIRQSLIQTGVPVTHCRELIVAFKQDAVKLRYQDWDDLMGYCRYSASPVGRYLLDLHGESRDAYPASDALCDALQVINHLQDCKDDYRKLDRVYLAGDWMAEAGVGVEDLDAAAASPGIRRVLDRTLDGVDRLMLKARTLPGQLRSRRLAMESAVIVRIAERLTAMLRRRDPIAGRVELNWWQFALCGMAGIRRTLR
ncbi:MAG: squalene synthase HpnC [Kiloniellales bacterium]